MFKPGLVTLQRGALRLQPLVEADVPWLVELARANEARLAYLNGPLRPDWYRQALAEQQLGQTLAFSIRLGERLVGCARFSGFRGELPSAELSGVWLDQAQHGSGLAAMTQYLLLGHAFSAWRLVRVEMRVAEGNDSAQGILRRYGVRHEGLLRNHCRLADGRLADSRVYGITDHDWPQIRQRLEAGFG